MAPPQRQHEALLEHLQKAGRRFGFFQAVQVIHRLMPDAVRVGELGPPENEAIRFLHDPSLVFHASDVSGIKLVERSGLPPRLDVMTTFLGLVGASSPLATVFSEDVLRAEWRDQFSLRSFYDIFHHRLVSLFFRAWHRTRFAAAFQGDGSDVFSRRMLSFVGVDLGGARPRRGLAPLELLALAPLVAGGGKTARTMQIVLERFTKTRVRVEQFVARQVSIGNDQRCLLGVQNCTLNDDFVIGSQVIDRSGRFRVIVGPVDYATFETLMPGGRRHAHLREVIMQFSPGHLEPELEVFVGAEQTPRFQLGGESGSELGVTTHLAPDEAKPMRARVMLSEDVDEAVARFVSDLPPPPVAA